MRVGSYLLRRGRTYFFRCRLPSDVAARAGRREVVKTLGTRDPAVARLRAAAIAVALGEVWAQARMSEADADIERLLDVWFGAAVKRAYAPLGRGTFALALAEPGMTSDEIAKLNRELFAEEADRMLGTLADQYHDGDYSAGHYVANVIASKLGFDRSDKRYAVTAKRVVEARGRIEEARARWASGDVDYTPSRRTSPAEPPGVIAQAVPARPDDGLTLADAVQRFLNNYQRQQGQKERYVTQAKSELQVLLDALGPDTKANSVTRAQAGRVLDGLRSLPAGFRQHNQLVGLPFDEAASKACELGLNPMHPRTVKGYIARMSALFAEEVMLGRADSNPFAEMKVPAPKRAKQARDFTSTELSALLGSPLFMGAASDARPYDSGNVLIANWQFWSVMIALMTGARIGEIAQLRPEDVRQQDGIWVFDINERGDKSLKTASSTRLVPVHSELVRVGLLRLVERQREARYDRLLPGAPSAVGGDPGKQLSKWMSEKFLRRLGIKRDGLGYHSFRHHLRTMLRSAEVNERVADAVTGHATGGVGANYGKAQLAAMAAALEKVTLPPEVARVPARG